MVVDGVRLALLVASALWAALLVLVLGDAWDML